jgi:hypothetical protein
MILDEQPVADVAAVAIDGSSEPASARMITSGISFSGK